MEEEVLNQIASIFKNSIIESYSTPRPILSYSHQQKTVGGRPVKDNNAIASGNLINNLNVYWEVDFNLTQSPILVVELPEYYYYLENGRKPGSYPPLNKISAWVRTKKGAYFRDKKGRFISNKTKTFLVGYSIAKYGFAGHPFFERATELALPTIIEDLGGAAAEFFQEAINKGQLLKGL